MTDTVNNQDLNRNTCILANAIELTVACVMSVESDLIDQPVTDSASYEALVESIKARLAAKLKIKQ